MAQHRVAILGNRSQKVGKHCFTTYLALIDHITIGRTYANLQWMPLHSRHLLLSAVHPRHRRRRLLTQALVHSRCLEKRSPAAASCSAGSRCHQRSRLGVAEEVFHATPSDRTGRGPQPLSNRRRCTRSQWSNRKWNVRRREKSSFRHDDRIRGPTVKI